MQRALAIDERGLFYVALAFATAVFVFAWHRPLLWLLGVVPDDAFYYLGIARNLADHGLSSFDGVNPTNGYHPGWMVVVSLLAKVFDGRETLLRSSLAAAFAFHLASSVTLAGALKRWLPHGWAYIGGAGWAVNPLPVSLALQAMEGSFYTFALSFSLWVYSTRIASSSPSTKQWIAFGLSLSLCFLARTEAIVLAGLVIVVLAARWGGAKFVRTARIMGLTGGAFVAGIAPWFIFSRWATGTWTQGSGAMKMLWAADEQLGLGRRLATAVGYVTGSWLAYPILSLPDSRWFELRRLLTATLTLALAWVLVRGLRRPVMLLGAALRAPPAVVLLGAALRAPPAVVLLGAALRAPPAVTRHAAAVGLVLLIGTIMTGSVYGLLFHDEQSWYRAQPGFLLYVVLYSTAVLGAMALFPRLPQRVASVALLALFGVALVVRTRTLNPYPWQRDVFTSQAAFERFVPSDRPIGCFNAGIPGYFGDRTIVNLDGLVNNRVYPYYKERAFDDYVADAGIDYVADETAALERAARFTRHPLALEKIAHFPNNAAYTEKRYLWRVVR